MADRELGFRQTANLPFYCFFLLIKNWRYCGSRQTRAQWASVFLFSSSSASSYSYGRKLLLCVVVWPIRVHLLLPLLQLSLLCWHANAAWLPIIIVVRVVGFDINSESGRPQITVTTGSIEFVWRVSPLTLAAEAVLRLSTITLFLSCQQRVTRQKGPWSWGKWSWWLNIENG